MNFRMAQRILGLMLMIFSLTMLPPIAVSFLYADGHWQPFLVSAAIIAAAGLLLWLPARNTRRDLRLRDGFLIVVGVLGLPRARRRDAAATSATCRTSRSRIPCSRPCPASRPPARR